MRFPKMWYLRPAKPQISLRIRALCQSLAYFMSVELLTEHHLEFLSLKGGCTGSSESTLVKMSHCCKSHVTAQMEKSAIKTRLLTTKCLSGGKHCIKLTLSVHLSFKLSAFISWKAFFSLNIYFNTKPT